MSNKEQLSVSLLSSALDELCRITEEVGAWKGLEKVKLLVAKVREDIFLGSGFDADEELTYRDDMERQTRLMRSADELMALCKALLEELVAGNPLAGKDLVALQNLIRYIENGGSLSGESH